MPDIARPIFTGDYPSFGDFDREALRRVLGEPAAPAPILVEVGSWLGAGSTQIMIEAAKARCGRLHCVDTWQGSPGVARHQELVAAYDVLETFRHNVRQSGGEGIVVEHRTTSLEAASTFADRSVDLVFIDADHKYESVRADIMAWMPKVRPGGLLVGHDCETRVRVENRAKLLAARDRDHIEGEPPFAAWHAGVIVAVDELFGGRARVWSTITITLEDGRPGRATCWDVTV